MIISVEISMYPLQDGYIPKIDQFLEHILKHNDAIEVRVSNMSSRLFGDFEAVTELLNRAMRRSMEKHGKIVFVCKYLAGDARKLEGYS